MYISQNNNLIDNHVVFFITKIYNKKKNENKQKVYLQTHLKKKLTQVVSKVNFVKQSLKIIKYDFTVYTANYKEM